MADDPAGCRRDRGDPAVASDLRQAAAPGFWARAVTGNASRPATGARRPYLIVNPRSGGGKASRFRIADRARALGAQVFLIDHSLPQDLAAVARPAVDDGADLLGVAGGDGTQALVAEVAAESGLPFVVVPVGTCNHFAMDLGLDREGPSAALEALTDGVELRVDLGYAGERAFVRASSAAVGIGTVQAESHREVVAGTRRNDHEGQSALRSHLGDKRPCKDPRRLPRASGERRRFPGEGSIDQDHPPERGFTNRQGRRAPVVVGRGAFSVTARTLQSHASAGRV
ncbi:hypothetical protein CK485_21475 [Streptomyces sp. ICBB 8177]|nr:hypothetical protein CK485_21475 [Streptomyces sp. ICBB 8177]